MLNKTKSSEGIFRKEKLKFNDFGVFLCGGPFKMHTIKKFIDCIAAMGYNSMRWEVGAYLSFDDDKRLNYMTGRYTKEQMQDIDGYALSKGIELIPCAQMFGHLSYIWSVKGYSDLFDTREVFEVDNPGVYDLIKKIILNLKAVFHSKRIHLGFDETVNLGLGKYLEDHGYVEAGELYVRHLKKVLAIADECGVSCEIWGDMYKSFVRKYRKKSPICTKDYAAEFPKNVKIIEWFYEWYSREELRDIFSLFKGVNDLAYCDGANCWAEFSSHNWHSINSYENHIAACEEFGINTFLVSIWYDSRGEQSVFSVLPSLFHCSILAHGQVFDDNCIALFQEMFGIKYEDFMSLDLMIRDIPYQIYPLTDSLLFADLLRDGSEKDFSLKEGYIEKYNKLSNVKTKDYQLIFDSTAKLAQLLSVKATLGFEIVQAYKSKDIEKLMRCNESIVLCISLLDDFFAAFSERYLEEYTDFDFHIHCNRIGGIRQNLLFSNRRLSEYIDGKIEKIDELEEQIKML